MVATVEDLLVEQQVRTVEGAARAHGWPFERIEPRCFRVTLTARNGDVYQVAVDFTGFPVQPAAFHWRNPYTGAQDILADSPKPYSRPPNYFHYTGRICAPWNRLASTPGGPHEEWRQSVWQEQAATGSTVTLAAMVLRISHELRSKRYSGRRP